MNDTIYELRDASDSGVYYSKGIFFDECSALAVIDGLKEPWTICRDLESGFARLELHEMPVGLNSLGRSKVVWSTEWREEYDETTDKNHWVVT